MLSLLLEFYADVVKEQLTEIAEQEGTSSPIINVYDALGESLNNVYSK